MSPAAPSAPRWTWPPATMPRPDAGADLHEQQEPLVPPVRPVLADRHDVDVVVDQRRHAEPFGEALPDGVQVPARHDRRRHGPAGGELDRARGGRRHAAQLADLPPGLSRRSLEGLLQPREHDVGAFGDGDVLGVLGQHAAGQVGDRHPGVGRSDVAGQHHPDVAVERQHRRGSPARGRAVAARHEQAVGEQRVDPLGDGGAGQAGQVGEVTACVRVPAANEVEDRSRGARGPGDRKSPVRACAHGDSEPAQLQTVKDAEAGEFRGLSDQLMLDNQAEVAGGCPLWGMARDERGTDAARRCRRCRFHRHGARRVGAPGRRASRRCRGVDRRHHEGRRGAARGRARLRRRRGDWSRLPDIDVVHICTPNHLHEPLAVAALDGGQARHLREAPRVRRCRRHAIAVAAARPPGVVAVPFVYRFHPMVREARVRVEPAILGPIRLLHGSYLQDWMSSDDDWSWRVEPDVGRAVAGLRRHRFALVRPGRVRHRSTASRRCSPT